MIGWSTLRAVLFVGMASLAHAADHPLPVEVSPTSLYCPTDKDAIQHLFITYNNATGREDIKIGPELTVVGKLPEARDEARKAYDLLYPVPSEMCGKSVDVRVGDRGVGEFQVLASPSLSLESIVCGKRTEITILSLGKSRKPSGPYADLFSKQAVNPNDWIARDLVIPCPATGSVQLLSSPPVSVTVENNGPGGAPDWVRYLFWCVAALVVVLGLILLAPYLKGRLQRLRSKDSFQTPHSDNWAASVTSSPQVEPRSSSNRKNSESDLLGSTVSLLDERVGKIENISSPTLQEEFDGLREQMKDAHQLISELRQEVAKLNTRLQVVEVSLSGIKFKPGDAQGANNQTQAGRKKQAATGSNQETEEFPPYANFVRQFNEQMLTPGQRMETKDSALVITNANDRATRGASPKYGVNERTGDLWAFRLAQVHQDLDPNQYPNHYYIVPIPDEGKWNWTRIENSAWDYLFEVERNSPTNCLVTPALVRIAEGDWIKVQAGVIRVSF